jgi:uncharacterized protein YcbK (DUF882 family)
MGFRNEYRSFLVGLKLRYFKPSEILNYADRYLNTLPPREYWGNLAPTIWLLDNFRDSIGKPIRLTSIYRSPAYNRKVGGGSQSYHMKNMAVDFQVDGMGPTAVFNRLLKIRQANGFKGGLGKYSTFVHIDTRGYNATW